MIHPRQGCRCRSALSTDGHCSLSCLHASRPAGPDRGHERGQTTRTAETSFSQSRRQDPTCTGPKRPTLRPFRAPSKLRKPQPCPSRPTNSALGGQLPTPTPHGVADPRPVSTRAFTSGAVKTMGLRRTWPRSVPVRPRYCPGRGGTHRLRHDGARSRHRESGGKTGQPPP